MNHSSKKLITASLVAVLACLIALIGGVSAFFSGQEDAARLDNSEFAEMLDEYSDALDKLETGKSENAENTQKYDDEKAAYDEALLAYTKAVADYEADVMEYNQNLLAYAVGKTALSSGSAGISEAKQQLEAGWAAYEQGKAEFDKGKAAYEEKLNEYNAGKAAYDEACTQLEQLEAVIEVMEQSGYTHQEALDFMSEQLGMELTDEYIAAAKAELEKTGELIELAGAALPEAEAQIAAGEEQLGSSYAMLTEGQKQLDAAEAEFNAGQAQLNSMSSSMDGAPERLKEAESTNAQTEAALDEQKSALKAQEAELKKYEGLGDNAARWRETLIDKGYGDSSSTDLELLNAARADSDAQVRRQNAESALRSLSLALMLLAVVCTVIVLWRVYKTGTASLRLLALAAASAVLYLGCTAAHSVIIGSANILAILASLLLAVSLCALFFTARGEKA